jgi:hypothetical protein
MNRIEFDRVFNAERATELALREAELAPIPSVLDEDQSEEVAMLIEEHWLEYRDLYPVSYDIAKGA